jgi:outer membrane protein assembly factor BamD (BamD/ComL family)
MIIRSSQSIESFGAWQVFLVKRAASFYMTTGRWEQVRERLRLLVEIYQYHNQQFATLVGKEYSAGTLKKFKTALSSLEAFIKWKFAKADISIKDLNYQFITDYEFYLKAVRGLQHNSAMEIIKKLKKIVRQRVANDWINKDPFMTTK